MMIDVDMIPEGELPEDAGRAARRADRGATAAAGVAGYHNREILADPVQITTRLIDLPNR